MKMKARIMYDPFGSIGVVFDVNSPSPGNRSTELLLFASIHPDILGCIKEHEENATKALVDVWDADAAEKEPVPADEFRALVRVGQTEEQEDGFVRVLLRVRPTDKKLALRDEEMVGDPVKPEDLE